NQAKQERHHQMNDTLRYNITAVSKAHGKRVKIFTWTRHPGDGVLEARKNADELGLSDEFSDYRAELVVDTTKHYKTRSGKKVTIHDVVPLSSVGEEVTYPIKCSIRADKRYARSRYAILTIDGLQEGIGRKERPDDIVGYWSEEV